LADTCAFADEQGRSFSALYSWAAWAAARRALEVAEDPRHGAPQSHRRGWRVAVLGATGGLAGWRCGPL